MSFLTLRNQTTSRFTEIQLFLNYITSLEPTTPSTPTSLEVKIMRGLFYVHLYAAIEKTMNDVVQKSLLLVSSENIKNKHYRLSFSTISVIDKIQSIKDSTHKKMFTRAIELFQEIDRESVRPLNEMLFARQLQNVWVDTIEQIALSFGITNLNIDPRKKATINEIVEKRNAVAHGGESASVVGESHKSDVLRVKLQLAQSFTDDIIDLFENFYTSKKYLKPSAKKYY